MYGDEKARIRKLYVRARVDELTGVTPPKGVVGNWRQYRKDQAHAEFNALIAEERAEAVRLALAERVG